ncbi:MAG: hypothetical protein KDJ99_20120 [Candidatus Competibacteraceae bacterium]|nr:hypothetical protein [Candidatus Competibacteraceae bacterium]
MKFCLPVILAGLLALTANAAQASDYGIREWTNDSKLFFTQVLEPVREQLLKRGCVEEVDFYVGPLFAQLREIKTHVSAKSYLLLRDIILTAAEDLAPFEEQMNCQVMDRWPFFENHIHNKIELIGNVFLILE